ncbi:hypothetical protein PINS_up012302 [Pythium insidiosum]|nr:hypothetical protein PINS_up012302 [Pythium insidiosum]
MGLLPDAMRSSRAWMRTKMLRLRSCKRTDTVVVPPTTEKHTDDSSPVVVDTATSERAERARSSPSDDSVRQRPKRLRKAKSQQTDAPPAESPPRSCLSCQRSFESGSSKYLDYCSDECKTAARGSSGDQRPSIQREWI